MRHNILIGSKAGQGIDALSQLLSALFVKKGLYVFNCRDYQSLIRGGHNFNIVCISDKPAHSYDNKIDLLVALDSLTFDEHKSELKEDSIVLTAGEDVNGIFLDVSKLGKSANVAFAGAVAKICGCKVDDLLGVVKAQFKEEFYEANKKAAEDFFNRDYGKKAYLPDSDNKVSSIRGSESIAKGAIDAGVQRYFGYPMTPATGVHTHLQNKQNKNLHVFNYENELGCINAAIGASFSGKRAMAGSAGGGFDLMSEALSFAGMAEIPLVVHLAQRPGPGTGLPTYTSQTDTNIALYAGHGDFPRVVVTPGDAAEGYEKVREAFYFAEKFNIPVILLTDKHMLESCESCELKKHELNIPERKDYPGKSVFKRSSYEHDEKGATIEDAETVNRMVQKRLHTKTLINKEAEKFVRYKTFGEGDTLLIGYGSTKGAVIDAKLENVKYLHLMYLEPFPTEIIEEIKKAKKIIVIEQNAGGQLAELMQRHLCMNFDKRILKYDGRPFTPELVRKEVQDVRD